MDQIVIPRECRDREDQTEAYETTILLYNEKLVAENTRLKKLLRYHGVPWSCVSREHLNEARNKKDIPRPARLPMELLLHVLKFAMTSPHPIIDPLSPPSSENLSTLEKCRGNQIAIHFLSTCRALHDEGTAYLWERNQFIFTSPQALCQLKRLDLRFRRTIKHITLRVIAHYFDDTDRQHMLEADYHPDVKTNRPLKVQRRLQRFPLVPGDFRCYTWLQIVDFLAALRSPYDHLDQLPRLFMLPSLTSLRLDLVNFSTELVPMPGPEFHDMVTHQLGCQLNDMLLVCHQMKLEKGHISI